MFMFEAAQDHRLCIATMVAAVTLAGTASAEAEAARKLSPAKAVALEHKLGSRAAGTYQDARSGNMIIAVTDAKSARRVRRAGGIAKVVRRDGALLDRVVNVLKVKARIPGTGWGIHPDKNRVVMSVDSTVSPFDQARLRALVVPFGKAVRIDEMQQPITPMISGGDAIFGLASRCSLGFNVVRGGAAHFLTAGHCTQNNPTWTVPGTTAGSSFPGNDYGIVRYTNDATPRPNNVTLYNGSFQTITAVGNAVVGQAVTRSGSTTRVSSGRVTAVNVTVNYPGDGQVGGLVRTTACGEPGDSGGPLFAGSTALGLLSGASGNCRTGGATYFQPVTEALAAYGAALIGPPAGPTPPPPGPTPPPAGPGATLGSNGTLASGQALSTTSGYAVRMQTDGNLVVIAPGNRPVWNSGTHGNAGAIARMQSDGNLVVIAPGNRPVWNSRTAGNPGAIARMQEDGNLVVIAPGNRPVWNAGTNPR